MNCPPLSNIEWSKGGAGFHRTMAEIFRIKVRWAKHFIKTRQKNYSAVKTTRK